MANEEHLEILGKGVEEWNRWREENREVRPDLIRAHLRGAHLRGADLRGADLSDADLSDTNLSFAHLSFADLSGADLSFADLIVAGLSGAHLRGAYLSCAQLSCADLSDADLSGADLSCAQLSGTILSGADLSDADLGETVFADVDLRQVKGLESMRHRRPSPVSTSTLERSRGQIPAAFLRGCGLSDWEVEAAKLHDPDLSKAEITTISYELIRLRGQGHAFFSAFISYSHEDQRFARVLHDELQGRGVRCWRDEKQMLPGDDIYDSIDRGIRVWDKVLLLCSESSLTSSWVEDEIDKALEKERKLRRERGEKVLAIIPLDLDGYLFDGWRDGRASVIRKRLAADFRGWKADPPDKLDPEALERVMLALRADAEGRESEPMPKI